MFPLAYKREWQVATAKKRGVGANVRESNCPRSNVLESAFMIRNTINIINHSLTYVPLQTFSLHYWQIAYLVFYHYLKGKSKAKYNIIYIVFKQNVEKTLFMRDVKNNICALHQVLQSSHSSGQYSLTVYKLDIGLVHRSFCLGKTWSQIAWNTSSATRSRCHMKFVTRSFLNRKTSYSVDILYI
jgi:hypothetical protein